MTIAGIRPSHLLTLSVLAALAGCSPRPAATISQTVGKAAEPADELGESVRDQLRRSVDPATCRRLIDQLNGYLPRAGADHRPAPLSAGERVVLEKEFALRSEEVAEVARSEFTPVDANYLDESLLFRDIARSLDVDRLPPVGKAEAACAWVARNLRGTPASGPALPVGFVAMRGAGTAVERTYVLLALLNHLGLDAALVGDAGAGPDGVWAVGVLSDGQIYLFDARFGLPLPGPDGLKTLTLAQARTVADPFKPLNVDPKLAYDVSADRVKRAEIFVTAPLSALSPRMRFVQGIIGEDTARLAADPVAQLGRFRKAVGESGGPTVKLWCPPTIDAVPRLLFAFLPAAEGGGDASAPGRINLFRRSQIPLELLPPVLRDLQGEPGARILSHFHALATGLDQPGSAHDFILRGQFREATDLLVAVQTGAKRRPGNVAELTKNTEEWATVAREYAAEKARREHGRGNPNAGGQMEQNQFRAEQLWRSPVGPVAFLEYAAGDLLAAQATYLLGQCKHEEAERQRDRPDAAGPAWTTAQHWWRAFLTSYPTSPWAPAAQRNLANALAASGQRPAARTTYLAVAESAPSPFDRLACRYLAERLK